MRYRTTTQSSRPVRLTARAGRAVSTMPTPSIMPISTRAVSGLTVIALAILALAAASGGAAPVYAEESVSSTPPPAPVFPQVRGKNLEGRAFDLPADFEGDLNLVFIAFERGQQAEVDTWLPLARKLATEIPGVRYYELPTIRELPGFVRNWIDGGMRDGIPDPTARAATITLYIDKDPFRRSLDIRTEKSISIVVVDRAGTIRWQTIGLWTPEKEEALRRVLAAG